MLIITRHTDQKLHIGDDVVITIARVRGRQVALGIEAPKDKLVVRAELLGRAPRYPLPGSDTASDGKENK